MSVLEINNREPTMSQKNIPAMKQPAVIWSAVGQDIGHPLQQMEIACSYETGDAAHVGSGTPRLIRSSMADEDGWSESAISTF